MKLGRMLTLTMTFASSMAMVLLPACSRGDPTVQSGAGGSVPSAAGTLVPIAEQVADSLSDPVGDDVTAIRKPANPPGRSGVTYLYYQRYQGSMAGLISKDEAIATAAKDFDPNVMTFDKAVLAVATVPGTEAPADASVPYQTIKDSLVWLVSFSASPPEVYHRGSELDVAVGHQIVVIDAHTGKPLIGIPTL